MLMPKLPIRVVEWVSKAWTEFEKELPVFYREALARLLCLDNFRNLIETQTLDAGTKQQRETLHVENPRDFRRCGDRTDPL